MPEAIQQLLQNNAQAKELFSKLPTMIQESIMQGHQNIGSYEELCKLVDNIQ